MTRYKSECVRDGIQRFCAERVEIGQSVCHFVTHATKTKFVVDSPAFYLEAPGGKGRGSNALLNKAVLVKDVPQDILDGLEKDRRSSAAWLTAFSEYRVRSVVGEASARKKLEFGGPSTLRACYTPAKRGKKGATNFKSEKLGGDKELEGLSSLSTDGSWELDGLHGASEPITFEQASYVLSSPSNTTSVPKLNQSMADGFSTLGSKIIHNFGNLSFSNYGYLARL